MNVSQNGIELIKKFEGVRLRAYIPVPGDVPTIGYGSTKNVKMGDTISLAEADQFLKKDLIRFVGCVNRCVTVALTKNQFDACVSLAFNVGCTNFKNSTLVRKLNAGDYDGAANQFPRWNRAGGRVLQGLTNRRNAEREVFCS